MSDNSSKVGEQMTKSTNEGPKYLKRRKVNLASLIGHLLDPEGFEGYYFLYVGDDTALELYRLMITSAAESGEKWRLAGEPNHLRYPDTIHYIGHNGSHTGSSYPEPFGADWRKDLRVRLLRALRSDGEIARWRTEQGFDTSGTKVVPYPFWEHSGVSMDLDKLFALASAERRTRKSYNKSHPRANGVDKVELHVRADGWRAVLWYKYPGDGSHWSGPSLGQKKGEPFSDFIRRAYEHLDHLLTPACRPMNKELAPVRHRRAACSAGWTGRDESGHEHIGGASLAEHAAGLSIDPTNPPQWILMPGAKYPSEVRRLPGEPPRFAHIEISHNHRPRDWDWEYWENRNGRGRALAEADIRLGAARFQLMASAMRRSYLDMNGDEQARAHFFFAPESGYGGSGPRGVTVAVECNSRGGADARPYENSWAFERTHCESGGDDGDGDGDGEQETP